MRRRDGESYLLIDHTESPGFTNEEAHRAGVPVHAHEIFAKGQKFEFGTKTCSHCQKQIVLRPERIRARHICPKCDKYICDACYTNYALTFECIPWALRIEKYLKRVIEDKLRSQII